ncbi:MAG TPA: DUF2269 family protein [Microthrixaceae bacterium]|nr:DUF2269 family protein [Microthrixaceae bacterium]
MGIGETGYDIVKVLHILCAVVGFGGVLLNGVYAAQARKRPPAEGLAVMEANVFVSNKIAKIAIYLTLVLGFGVVGMSDQQIEFTDLWVMISIILFIASLLVSELLLSPRVKKLVALQREIAEGPPPQGGPPPQVAQMKALGGQVGGFSGFLHLSFVVILCLMVFQPT